MAYEQEVAYVQQAQKKDAFDSGKYIEKNSLFGLIVFKSKKNLDPLTVYWHTRKDGRLRRYSISTRI